MKLRRITIELEDADGNTLQLTDGTDVTLDRSLHYLPSETTKRFDGRRFDDLVYVGRRIVRAAEAVVRAEDEREQQAKIEDSLQVDGRVVLHDEPVEGHVTLTDVVDDTETPQPEGGRPYNAIDIISRAEPSDGIGLGGRVVKERPKKAEDDDIDLEWLI